MDNNYIIKVNYDTIPIGIINTAKEYKEGRNVVIAILLNATRFKKETIIKWLIMNTELFNKEETLFEIEGKVEKMSALQWAAENGFTIQDIIDTGIKVKLRKNTKVLVTMYHISDEYPINIVSKIIQKPRGVIGTHSIYVEYIPIINTKATKKFMVELDTNVVLVNQALLKPLTKTQTTLFKIGDKITI